jgi:hypothetical protein
MKAQHDTVTAQKWHRFAHIVKRDAPVNLEADREAPLETDVPLHSVPIGAKGRSGNGDGFKPLPLSGEPG